MLPVEGFSVGVRKVFSGVCVKVLGLEEEDVKRIWAMVTWHGGKMVVEEFEGVTHVVTGAMDEFLDDNHYYIVTPDWVVESIKNGMMVEEVNFVAKSSVVHEPSVTTSNVTKPKLMRSKYYRARKPLVSSGSIKFQSGTSKKEMSSSLL